MNKLIAGLSILVSFAALSGEIEVTRFDSGDVVLKFDGEEAKEVYNRISKSEQFQGSSSGYLSSTTYIKRGKDISCTRRKTSKKESFECFMSVDHKGRVDSASY